MGTGKKGGGDDILRRAEGEMRMDKWTDRTEGTGVESREKAETADKRES